METTKNIPIPPSFTGHTRFVKFKEWGEKHLPEGFNEKYPWNEEAVIAMNRFGGRPSTHSNIELRKAITAYNNGTAYHTPNIDWNKKLISDTKDKIASGIDVLTPALEKI